MDDFDKELKELLNLELDISGIIVSEDLIKKTLKKAEEADVVTGQTKKPLFMKWQMRGLISVAALFLIVYVGYNIMKLNVSMKYNEDSAPMAENEKLTAKSKSSNTDMGVSEANEYTGNTSDGNASNAGGTMSDARDDSVSITNKLQTSNADIVTEEATENDLSESGSYNSIGENKSDYESKNNISDEDKYSYTHKALSDYLTEEDMKLAIKSGSDESALAAVIKKAEAGEKVIIACIGGSITQGAISDGTIDGSVVFKKSYADIFFEWFSTSFPNTEFEFINAGIGATDSYLGVHRVNDDVLSYHPDLVLIEFSVNDSDNIAYQNYYDNLTRTILLSEDSPAVVLLFMAQTNLSSAQNSHITVGFRYALPMLSYRDIIKEMMDQGRYTANQLSGDVTHPSALGHAIAGEMLWKYLNSIYSNLSSYKEPELFNYDALTNERYLDSDILDSKDIVPDEWGSFEKSSKFYYYPNNWTTTEGEGEIIFTITCRNLGILYYCTTDGLSGQFEVYVDNKKVTVLDADFSGGWGDYAKALEVYSSEKSDTHTVMIKKSEMSKGDVFSILGLLVSY